MAFYGYNGDAGECYWTPYNHSYESDPSQATSAYSYHEYNDSKLIEHEPLYDYHDPYATVPPEVNYSTYSFDQPKFLQYEPTPYVTKYIASEIKSTISYSTFQGFKLIEYDEYDPTPYGGGYDANQVYGKPLPASAEICYPLSGKVADGYSLEGFSFASIPSPYGKKDDPPVKPASIPSPYGEKDDPLVKPQNGDKQSNITEDDLEPRHEDQDQIPTKGDTSEEDSDSDSDSDHDHSVGNGGNGEIGEYGYNESSRPVSNIPYGSGLEAIDICECIFGHWPCVDKMNRERRGIQEAMRRESSTEPWKSAADYLFGSPFGGYGEQKDGGYGDYAYYSHGSYAQH